MILKIVGWWKGLALPWKIITGIFVAVVLVLVGVGGYVLFGRRRSPITEFSTVDAAVEAHEREIAKREKELQDLNDRGKGEVAEADRLLEENRKAGVDALEERERRHDEIDDSDDWDDLDSVLGNARGSGREGSRE